MNAYHIQLSFRMLVALCDIDEHYIGEESPSRDTRTTGALLRRGLVRRLKGLGHALTAKGKSYLEMARYEYLAVEEPKKKKTA